MENRKWETGLKACFPISDFGFLIAFFERRGKHSEVSFG